MICLYYPGYYLYPWSTLRKAHSYFFWPKKTNQSLQESAQVKYHVLDRDIQTDKLDRVMVVPSATLSQLDNVVYYRVLPFPFLFSSSRPPWPPADPESLMPQTTTFQKGFNLHRLSRRTPGCQSISLRGG